MRAGITDVQGLPKLSISNAVLYLVYGAEAVADELSSSQRVCPIEFIKNVIKLKQCFTVLRVVSTSF